MTNSVLVHIVQVVHTRLVTHLAKVLSNNINVLYHLHHYSFGLITRNKLDNKQKDTRTHIGCNIFRCNLARQEAHSIGLL